MSMSNRWEMLLVVAVLFLGGCEQLYTGSMGLNFTDRDQVEAYQKFKEEQAEQLAAGRLAARRTGPVDFGGTAPAGSEGHTRTHRSNVANTAFAPYATTHGQRVGTLGLYGRLKNSSGEQRSSPLNSPGDLRRMTFTVEGADFDPDTDPTGLKIVYASTRHRDTSDLYVKGINGSAVTQLTSDPANEMMPTFSPDGEWIAFVSDRSGTWDIYLMPARGGKARQLTSDVTTDLHPSFSPDGSQLIYCSNGGASGQWEMIIIDVKNPATKRVVGLGLFPTWSPTQQTILFQRARQRGTRWFSIWTVDLIEGEPTPPTEIAVSANAAVITPDWSPDGKKIVFCTVIDPEAEEEKGPTQADIWITASDGTGRVRMTSGQFTNLQPSWSADGTILFVSDRSAQGVENIWAVRPGRALDFIQPASNSPPATSVRVETE